MSAQSGPSTRGAVAGEPPNVVPAPRQNIANPLYLNLPVYISIGTILMAFFIKTAVHQIPEGHVGVYWRGGKLLQRITSPGIHTRIPLMDTYEAIQITMQTDKVVDILCGTKGGVSIVFDKIEVVNRLKRDHVYETIRDYGIHYDRTWIYDKIHHEINQFCSSHTLEEVYITKFVQVDEQIKDALQADCNRYAPGIEIIAVRVTKPSIPASVSANYVAMEVERTKALVALERQRVMEREAEAERLKALSEAQRAAETSAVRMQQLLAEKEAERAQAEIEDAMYLARQRVLADSNFYRIAREAEALRQKLTPQFLEYALIQALGNNTKMFFGDRLPSLLLDTRAALQGAFAALEAPAAASSATAAPAAAAAAAHGTAEGTETAAPARTHAGGGAEANGGRGGAGSGGGGAGDKDSYGTGLTAG